MSHRGKKLSRREGLLFANSHFQVLMTSHKDKEVTKDSCLIHSRFQVDVWGRPSKGVFDVMVDPKQLDDVMQFVKDRYASFKVKVPDVQRCVYI